MILCVCASPALDLTYRVNGLAVGGTNRIREVAQRPGGKAVNVARLLHLLGEDVHLVSTAGGDSGVGLAESLEHDGIPHELIPSAAPTRRTVAIVDDATGEVTMLNEPAVLEEWPAYFAAVSAQIPAADVLVISGRLPAVLRSTASRSSPGSHGALTARWSSTPADRPCSPPSRRPPTIVKPNADELRECTHESDPTAGRAIARGSLAGHGRRVARRRRPDRGRRGLASACAACPRAAGKPDRCRRRGGGRSCPRAAGRHRARAAAVRTAWRWPRQRSLRLVPASSISIITKRRLGCRRRSLGPGRRMAWSARPSWLPRRYATARGVAAINVITLEHAEAIAPGAALAGQPVILAISQNTVRFHGGQLEPLSAAAAAVARLASTPISLHLDHVTDDALVDAAAGAGYSSVMYDGGALSYADNVARTVGPVKVAQADGLWVEAELGYVGGKPDAPQSAHAAGVRTDPDEAVDFVAQTGVDALAVAVGSSHAMTSRSAELDLPLIEMLRARLACRSCCTGPPASQTGRCGPRWRPASPRSTSARR